MNFIRGRKGLLLSVLLLSLFLIVGCSSDNEQLIDHSTFLRVSVDVPESLAEAITDEFK